MRQARIFEPPFQHLAHGVRRIAGIGEPLAFAVGRAEERRFIVLISDASGIQIFPQPLVDVMADGDLAQLAPFLAEAQRPVLAQVPQVTKAQPRDRADARASIGEDAEDGAIAQADDMARIDGAQELACLLDADFRRRAFAGVGLDPALSNTSITCIVTSHYRQPAPNL
jgi:hypothetical protein